MQLLFGLKIRMRPHASIQGQLFASCIEQIARYARSRVGKRYTMRRMPQYHSPSEKPIGGLFGRTAWTKLKTIDAIRFNKLNFSYILVTTCRLIWSLATLEEQWPMQVSKQSVGLLISIFTKLLLLTSGISIQSSSSSFPL